MKRFGMERNDFHLQTEDGVRLACSVWKAAAPRGLLIWLHGYAEHRLRYEHFGEWLSDRNLSFAALDFRGHGASEGPRGYVKTFEDYFLDVDALLKYCREELGVPAPALGAHSNGGLVALRYILEHPEIPFPSLVLTSPHLGLAFKPAAWKLALGHILKKVYPRFTLPNGVNPDHTAKDKTQARLYATDPLIHRVATAGFFFSSLENLKTAVKRAGEIKLPLLHMISPLDQMANPITSRAFFESVGSRDKRKIEYEDKYHEILQEPGKEELYETIQEWILERL